MISEDEWSIMKSNFTVDKEISVSRNKTDQAEFFATEPPVCDECLEKRCREEEEEQLINHIPVNVLEASGSQGEGVA